MKKGSFIIYDADLKALDYLTDIQAGKLFKAIAKYRLAGAEPNLGSNAGVNILYQQIIEHIILNEDKYKAICNRNSESAKKRWHSKEDANGVNNMPTHTDACERIQKDTKLCLYDNDNVNDNDNDIDIDNVNDNDNDIDIDNVNVNDTVACGAKKENKRKNYYNKKQPFAYEGEPSYDIDAFLRKAIGLKYEKKERPQKEKDNPFGLPES